MEQARAADGRGRSRGRLGQLAAATWPYGVAALSVAAAAMLRLVLDPYLGNAQPFAFFYLAVAFLVWWLGWRPALVALVLGYLAAHWLFLPPRHALRLETFADVVELLTYGFVTGTTVFLMHSMRQARQRAGANAALAQQKERELEADIAQRKGAEAALREQAQLAQLRADATQALQQPAAMQVLLQRVAALLVERLEGAFARVWTLDATGQTLELQASAGLYTHLDGAHSRVPVGQLKIGRIAREGRPHVTNQVIGDPNVPEQAWARREGLVAFAGFPLLLEGRLLGVVALFARHKLSAAAVETFHAIAGALALALGRKQVQEALLREKEFSAALIDSLPGVFYLIDAHNRLRRWNKNLEQVSGYEAAEIPRLRALDFLAQPDREAAARAIAQVLTRGEATTELQLLTKAGATIPFVFSAKRFEVEDQPGLLGVGSDISERTQAEAALRAAREELARANAELERKVQERTATLRETVAELEHFSYTITHDMRAPLRAMRSFCSILFEECAGCLGPERFAYLRCIADAAQRMDRLVTDALQYSGVVRQRLELEPVDAGALLRGILDSYPQFQLPRARIRIDGPLPRVLGNPAALTQCFSNLLDNAVKFVHPGRIPEVRVWAEGGGESARRRDGETESGQRERVRIWVEDNGIGIEAQYHDKIWQMFEQLDKNYEGTGIGLALVRKAVERMGGAVGVQSEPGHGSRFWIELQQLQQSPQPDPSQEISVCQ